MSVDPASPPGAQPWPLRSAGEGTAVSNSQPVASGSIPDVSDPAPVHAASPDVVPVAAARSTSKVAAPAIPVTAKPGGLAFTLGSGRGQFLLMVLACAVVLLAVFASVEVAIHALAALMASAAVMRLMLPAIKVPALVNRGRGFDVTIFVLCGTVLEALLLSGIEL